MMDDLCDRPRCRRLAVVKYLGTLLCWDHWLKECEGDLSMVPDYPDLIVKETPTPQLTLVEAASACLEKMGHSMSCSEMIKYMKEWGLWSSRARTPERTLHSALSRLIRQGDLTFRKMGPGCFDIQR